eukprot:TRINITY_DN14049_c0_g1_i1.p1 TRINITY_DN14049_c0_g1~~TRINITY_DN14049_c0_g1_i1.p1  ORF type:complete len:345 (-),score=73.08 TRINITY_DN14049_c0_g1_i1:165-1199(-)
MEKLVNPYREKKSPTILAKETAELILKAIQETDTKEIEQFLQKKLPEFTNKIIYANPLEFAIENTIKRVFALIKTTTADYLKTSSASQSTKKSLAEMVQRDPETNSDPPTIERLDSYESAERENILHGIKREILESLENLIDDFDKMTEKISENAPTHIKSNDIVVTYGESTLVQDFLVSAAKSRKFEVIVIEDELCKVGKSMCSKLEEHNIPTTFTLPTATYAIMSRANKVILSPNAIMADGGIISNSGTLLLTAAAKAHSVPVIVIAGLFKLTSNFPFSQDTFNEIKSPTDPLFVELSFPSPLTNVIVPKYDYIEPEYISLYITDAGEHTPSYIYRLFREYY